MPSPTTIIQLLTTGSDGATAISMPGRPSLSYAGLRDQVQRTVAALNGFGIGRGDPVAIVLPNGPEMASAFVSVGAGATTAPLNPAYTAREFEFYLTDLQAKLLLVQRGVDTPAIGVAQKLGLQIVYLNHDDTDPAGVFDLVGESPGREAKQTGFAEPDDVALVLHTSGTTSRPKIVPLTQQNICASAANIAGSVALTPQDCCLNIMPLFHIHGLIAAVLSSLYAGATVSCAPGFNALRFFTWMKEIDPSWYTAVPTMHQAILARASRNQDIIDAGRLRLIRSSSASLPPQIMDAVEKAFAVPVIEAYGMTEAAHQMASNPLPPRKRVPGSVGVAAGPEIAIMDDAGTRLPVGDIGEIVIRGANVTAGYQSNPEANAAAYADGWFRTGDQGVLDDQGYLRLTDRLKEIINRGGEKISPREVDEVILDHPDIDQVVTFAVPHEKLGEDIAAAVVLADGATLTKKDLQKFVAKQLADFKVPREILFVEEIPKGATGKLARIGLAEKLGLAG
jgi:acyl-CoA synthetase (AMP-forming)/AMP-acid ligase II